jgi:hypothetical protein
LSIIAVAEISIRSLEVCSMGSFFSADHRTPRRIGMARPIRKIINYSQRHYTAKVFMPPEEL